MTMKRRVFTGARYRGKNEDGSYGFTAATQLPVQTEFGPEILLMSGADLTRYRSNNVVINNHNMRQPVEDAVIGNGLPQVVGQELQVDITFDVADKSAARVAGKVERGFVKALSVGWNPKQRSDGMPAVVHLGPGETGSYDGRSYEGPMSIVTSWELIEVSVVPVGADQFALMRGFDVEKEREMKADPKDPPVDQQPEEGEAEDADKKRAEEEEEDEEEGEEMEDKEDRAAEDEEKEKEPDEDKEGSRAAPATYSRATVDAEIRGIAPEGMRHLADVLVIEQATVEAARAKYTEELQKKHTNLGSTEPSTRAPSALDSISDEDFAAAFTRTRGFLG